MHTASYEFLMKPKESARCHQTLSARVGSGDETMQKYAEIASLMMSCTHPLFITLPECLQYQKWCPNKGRGVVSAPICVNKVRMVQTVPTFLQQPPCAQHVATTPTNLTLSHLAQNLSSKQIAPTNNMWPK